MPGVADQDQGAALSDVALALVVDLGHQRAGRVEHRDVACGGLLLDRLCDAMGAEDRHRIGRHLGKVLDEARALGLQALDHMAVVDDLVAHVDRRTVFLQRALDDLDRAHDAGAKTSGLGENDLHVRLIGAGEKPVRDHRPRQGSSPETSASTRSFSLRNIDKRNAATTARHTGIPRLRQPCRRPRAASPRSAPNSYPAPS